MPGRPVSGASSCFSVSIAATCCSRGSVSNRSSEALAAAQASGLPHRWGHQGGVGIIRQKCLNTSVVATVAARLIAPPVSALPRQMISGTMLSVWANSEPAARN